MREKNGLDKNALNNIIFDNDFKKTKKKINKIVEKFNEEAIKCKNFCFKKEKLHSQIYWCKKTDKSCIFTNCPKNNNEDVDN